MQVVRLIPESDPFSSGAQRQPGSCAVATTGLESKYRVQYPNSQPRVSCIFTLDESSAEQLTELFGNQYTVNPDVAKSTDIPFQNARLLKLENVIPIDPATTKASDLHLQNFNGDAVQLDVCIEGADVCILIASENKNMGAAEVIAREAFNRKIMTAGLALGLSDAADMSEVINALRPFASVLVVANGTEYITDMLLALRA